MEDILLNPPATGQYDKFKNELIRILAELDSDRVKRLEESEVMGDRKPFQFYYDLKKKLPVLLRRTNSSSRFGGIVYPITAGKSWLRSTIPM